MGCEPMASVFHAAVLYQLSYEDPYTGKQANLLSSSICERNETENEIMLTVGIQIKWIIWNEMKYFAIA